MSFYGDIFTIFFLLLEFGLTDEFFLLFLLSFGFLLFYFYLLPPSLTSLYIMLIEDSLFLLFAFFTTVLLCSPNRLHCDALWWLRRVKVDAWWLLFAGILIYLCYFIYLWSFRGYFINLLLEFANFGLFFFFLLLLNFLSIQIGCYLSFLILL